jgi:outer membrane lipoprotein-sorting protein
MRCTWIKRGGGTFRSILLCVVLALGISDVSYAAIQQSKKELAQRLLKKLQDMRILHVDFVEISRNRQRFGKFFMKRPPVDSSEFGQFCLIYDDPEKPGTPVLQVIGTKGVIHILNYVKQSHDETPIETTPLALVLRGKVKVGNFLKIQRITSDAKKHYITLADPKQSDGMLGTVTFVFDRKFYNLLGWQIRDFQDNRMDILVTKWYLSDFDLPDSVFMVPQIKKADER